MEAGEAAEKSTVAPGWIVCLLIGCLCLTRPSLFGQDYNYLGGIGIVVTTLVYLLTYPGTRLLFVKSTPELSIAVALLVFWSYVFGMSILLGNSNWGFLFKASAAGFSVPVCFLLLSSNGKLVDQTFSAFARINSVLGYSIAITSFLLPIVGYSGLRLFGYAISGYDDGSEGGNGDVLFPFSMVYGSLSDYGIYRFCGIYREAGIAQALFVWAFVYLMYSRAKLRWILGSMLGALLCGATAVVFSFAAAAVVHFGSRSRQRPRELLILVLLLAVLLLLLLFVPGLGLLDKAVTHSSSLSDRQEGMEMALPSEDTLSWLFGHGLFFESPRRLQNSGINAIASIFQFGVVGFVLYVATFFAGANAIRSNVGISRYLTLISPLLITSLIFQPVVDSPLFMAVLFAFPQAVRTSVPSSEPDRKGILGDGQ